MCKAGYFFTPSGCNQCPASDTKYSDDTTIDLSCTCNSGNNFAWNVSSNLCVCGVGYYPNTATTCAQCPTTTEYAPQDTFVDNRCTCKSGDNYDWDATQNKCVCKANYYLGAASTCAECPTTAGYIPDSDSNGICNCDSLNNFKWDATSKTCTCK